MLSYTLSVLVFLSSGAGVTATPLLPYRIVSSPHRAPYRVGTPVAGTYRQTCEATIFCAEGDRWCGGASVYLLRPVQPTDRGVAHRTLPLGTKIRITNLRTQLSTTAIVLDRGPFVRINKRGHAYNGIGYYRRFLRAHKPIPTRSWSKGVAGWRGCLDITPAVGRRIRHNGKEDVTFEVIRWPQRRRRSHPRKPNT